MPRGADHETLASVNLRSHALIGPLAFVQVGIVAAGTAYAATRDHHVVAGLQAARPSHQPAQHVLTVDPIPSSAPVAAEPSPKAVPVDTRLVVGPEPHTAADADARTDLEGRIVLLNERIAVQQPDDLVDGGFRNLDAFVKDLPAKDQADQRQINVQDGFQGSEEHVWASTSSSEVYLVDLTRFATAQGATNHLSGFVDGALHTDGVMKHIPATIKGSLAFTETPKKGVTQITTYQARGRYFAITIVRAPNSRPSTALRKDATTLAAGVRLRMA